MARQQRICLPGHTYHVSSYCRQRASLMRPDICKEILLEVVDLTSKKYKFDLIAYQIMDNHFHFIIRTLLNEETISRIMQYIKARFAEQYNKRMKLTGPFWNGRFKDEIIEHYDNPQQYFAKLLWDLANEPVRHKIVSNARNYKYGFINAYLYEDFISPVKIVLHDYYIRLGDSFKERIQKFLLFENAI